MKACTEACQKRNILLAILVLAQLNCISQHVSGEEHIFDCNDYKKIVIPFTPPVNKTESSASTLNREGNTSPFFKKEETIYDAHKFSDWYRIEAKESSTLTFKVKPISNRDSFEVTLYHYAKGEDFCSDVYDNKLSPEKYSFYKNLKKENANTLKEKTFQAVKGQFYYLCILNTTLTNCGYGLHLNIGKDTLEMVSLYSTCLHDISELVINKRDQQKTKPINIISNVSNKAPIANLVAPANITIKCAVTDGKKNIHLESKLRIIDERTGKEIKIESENQGEFNFNVEKNKNYKVECSSLGYKNFDYSVNISKAISSTNLFIVQMKPLKMGNNFVMKNIYFHPNTYALRKESQPELVTLAEYMNSNNTIKIEIQGYTNGDKRIRKNKAYKKLGGEWNFDGGAKKLSRRRAAAIKEYLLLEDINPERIMTKGFGGDKMIVKRPRTMEDIQKNIRVEVRIVEN